MSRRKLTIALRTAAAVVAASVGAHAVCTYGPRPWPATPAPPPVEADVLSWDGDTMVVKVGSAAETVEAVKRGITIKGHPPALSWAPSGEYVTGKGEGR